MDRIVGQAKAIRMLQVALSSDRLHHAFIFHGPPGVGKFTTALAFARALLCHNAEPDLTGRVAACGRCESCRLLRRGPVAQDESASAHPDLHVVTKELARYADEKKIRERKLTNIPIDVLRQFLIEPVYRSAQLRHRKVFIVDEAELMAADGQNALLKTLEEPPAGTHLILVTSAEDRLLPTIRSRCHRVPFLALSDDVLERWLQEHGEALLAQTRERVRQQAERAKPRTEVADEDEDEAAPRSGKPKKRPNALMQPCNIPDNLTPQQQQWLVEFCAGSLGRAELSLRYNLFHWATAVLPGIAELGRGRYPAELGKAMAQGIDDLAEWWVKEHKNASKEAANKMAAGLMWSLISQHARKRLAEEAHAAGGADVLAAEAKLSPWLGVIEALTTVEQNLAANLSIGLVTEHLVSMMHRALAPATDRGVPASASRQR